MGDKPDNHEFAWRIAVLERRVNTRQAETERALDRLRAGMAQRDKDNTRWQIGLWIAAIVVLGNLIRRPGCGSMRRSWPTTARTHVASRSSCGARRCGGVMNSELPAPDSSTVNCHVAYCHSMMRGNWKPGIPFCISNGVDRFGAMRRTVPGIAKQMLTMQLRELESDGLFSRTVHAEIPPRAAYALTERERSALPAVEQMLHWDEPVLACPPPERRRRHASSNRQGDRDGPFGQRTGP